MKNNGAIRYEPVKVIIQTLIVCITKRYFAPVYKHLLILLPGRTEGSERSYRVQGRSTHSVQAGSPEVEAAFPGESGGVESHGRCQYFGQGGLL